MTDWRPVRDTEHAQALRARFEAHAALMSRPHDIYLRDAYKAACKRERDLRPPSPAA